jgi:hypothetical protein
VEQTTCTQRLLQFKHFYLELPFQLLLLVLLVLLQLVPKTPIGTSCKPTFIKDKPNSEEEEEPQLHHADGGLFIPMKPQVVSQLTLPVLEPQFQDGILPKMMLILQLTCGLIMD